MRKSKIDCVIIGVLFIPAILIGVLGIVIFFIKESFLLGYEYYKL